jgi:hypothetical protein
MILKLTRVKFSERKYSKIVGGWNFSPDPTGRAHSAPSDPLTGLRGGEGGKERADGKGKEGEKGKGAGREEGEGVSYHPHSQYENLAAL